LQHPDFALQDAASGLIWALGLGPGSGP